MKITHTLAAAGFATLLTTSALGANFSIREIPDAGKVEISGTVESIQNERRFTLSDGSDSIKVDIESQDSVVLQKGANVTVRGNVDKGLLSKDINATSIDIEKGLVQASSDAIEGHTGASMQGASSYTIDQLPARGMVKVYGTVSDVDSEKAFTLKDATGSVEIDVEGNQAAAIVEGAEVTVVGYVDESMFSKSINATKVLVTADATRTARGTN